MNPTWQGVADEDLMLRFQAGDAFAFEQLTYRYQQGVFRYFFRYLGNKEAAEEATQEVFFHVIRAVKNYEPRAKFSTWLYRIVHNHGIDCFRRNRLRKTLSLDQKLDDDSQSFPLLDHLADPTQEIEDEAAGKQLHDHLTCALETINQDQRQVFLMREDLGLSFQEIAKVTGVSTNTVKSRMRYALSGLRKILEKKFQPLKEAAGS